MCNQAISYCGCSSASVQEKLLSWEEIKKVLLDLGTNDARNTVGMLHVRLIKIFIGDSLVDSLALILLRED